MKKVQSKKLQSSAKKADNLNFSSDEEKAKNKEMFKVEHIEGTPFQIVTSEEEDVAFISMGNYKITENRELKKRKELIEDVKKITWDRLIQVFSVLLDVELKNKKDE